MISGESVGGGSESSGAVLDAVRAATALLREAGVDSPQSDAEVLTAFALGISRIEVIAHPERHLTNVEHEKIDFFAGERAKRIPLSYLTGTREFWSLDLEVTPAVLIPRQETETVVQAVVDRLRRDRLSIADVGAGSGAICIALAKELPQAGVYATELSREALEVAQRNVDKHQLGDRVSVLWGDLFEPLDKLGLKGKLDAVVSNPPYIPSGEIADLQPEVHYEPRAALDGGPDGLEVIRRIVAASPEFLKPDGMLFTEIGFDQGEAVKALAVQAGFQEIEVLEDLAGLDRVVCGRLRVG